MIQHKEGSLMAKHRNFSIFLGRTPQGAMMGVLCAFLIALLAACSGGSTSTTSGSTGGSLSGGTGFSGKRSLFGIQSSSSCSFVLPGVNGTNKEGGFQSGNQK